LLSLSQIWYLPTIGPGQKKPPPDNVDGGYLSLVTLPCENKKTSSWVLPVEMYLKYILFKKKSASQNRFGMSWFSI